MTEPELQQLASNIKRWSRELGFQQAGISDIDVRDHSEHLRAWLDKGYHGDMAYMSDRFELRTNPQQLHPNTQRVISLRMDYLPPGVETVKVLDQKDRAYVSRYALGRDYHKLIRKRVAQLADKIRNAAGDADQRPFVDSAPVLERRFAEKAGLGWIGKNTMLIHPKTGSWFFLAELFTNLPLPIDNVDEAQHCGSCKACLDICPTNAFVAPFQLDARKCISYLTIESRGSIPEPLREKMGNRVFGCDDCQLVCPWNKFSSATNEPDFKPRHNLDNASLVDLFLWTKEEFEQRTECSPIRRIGYERWLRNLAVGLGNGPASEPAIAALSSRIEHTSPLVQEHARWGLQQLQRKSGIEHSGTPAEHT